MHFKLPPQEINFHPGYTKISQNITWGFGLGGAFRCGVESQPRRYQKSIGRLFYARCSIVFTCSILKYQFALCRYIHSLVEFYQSRNEFSSVLILYFW